MVASAVATVSDAEGGGATSGAGGLSNSALAERILATTQTAQLTLTNERVQLDALESLCTLAPVPSAGAERS